jgi:RNA polymerase sigma factor for flagellar operon FliA
MFCEDSAALWARWREEGDAAARERLICLHLPYARMLAATLFARRMHSGVEFGDYLQLARIGLMEAVDRFDPTQGASFKTFASKRIQGAVLNGLVRLTEMNQQSNVMARLRQERLEVVKEAAKEAAGGSAPSAAPDALFRYLADVGIGLAIGVLLEDTGMIDADAFESDARMPSPEVSYFRKSEILRLREALRDRVGQLPEQQKKVIACHYQQEMPFDQIALLLRVTRARVAQLHRQGLSRLRELLGNDAQCDVSW